MQTQLIPKTLDQEREAERIALFARAFRYWKVMPYDDQTRLWRVRKRFLDTKHINETEENWLGSLVLRLGT